MSATREVVKALPSLLTAEVEVWRGGGLTHVASYYMCSAGASLGLRPSNGWHGEKLPPGSVRTKVSVATALEGCSECLDEARDDAFDDVPGWAEARVLVAAAKRARSIRKVTAATTSSTIAKRRAEVERVIEQAREGTSSSSAEVRAFARDTLVALEGAREELKTLGRDAETIKKVEAKIKALMVPKRFVGVVELDGTPHLVGISSLPWRVSPQVRAAMDAFAVRDDGDVVVLRAPAYVYAFLLQQLFSKSTDKTLVVGYPAPEEEEVCEVAAGVWDPEGESSLACMRAAIESARALV